MKQISLPLVMGLLVSFGCRTIPGQDVRYEPTPMPVVRAMLELADVGPQDIVYDLGSGDGRIPITAAKEFGARGVGIEIDPALMRKAQAKAREAGVADKVEFRLGDMYVADVRPATVVTLFLHPKPNLKLRPKLRSELQPGSRVVSYAWDMADWAPDEARRVNAQRIFLWRIPHRTALIIGAQLSRQLRHVAFAQSEARSPAGRSRAARSREGLQRRDGSEGQSFKNLSSSRRIAPRRQRPRKSSQIKIN
jgi:SAM-dependent methyltransferase